MGALLTGCGPSEAPAEDTPEQPDGPVGSGLEILPPDPGGIGPSARPEDLRLNFHSFGRVPMGDVVSHTFQLKNTDDRPLTVTRMKPACGCTIPSLSYMQDGERVMGKPAITRGESILTIPPGVVAELEVAMDSKHVPITNVDKTVGVMLTTDSPNGFYLHVETHIFVEKPFTQNPSGINFKVAPKNGITVGTTDLILNAGYDIKLTDIASLPEGMQAELFQESNVGQPIWRLEAKLLPPRKLGVWQESLFINQVDGQGQALEPLEVRMRAQIVDDLICEPSRIVFATQESASGAPSGLSITLRSLLTGHRFGIEDLLLPEAHRELFELSYEALAPDEEGLASAWTIRMTCKPGVRIEQLTSGTIRALLFDPQHPETSIDYVVHPPRS